MKITNLSAEPLGKLHSWIPHDLQAEQVVFLPDACPGKSPLPTGTAVLTRQKDWRKFAVSDCGCGMRLVRSSVPPQDFDLLRWDKVADSLRTNKGSLGDLGGGNHFLDAIVPYQDGPLHFLIHTGSRNESGLVDDLVDKPNKFDQEFERVVGWAADNRAAINEKVDAAFGSTEVLLDLPHNTFEQLGDGGVIIRKGSVQLAPGELSVLPSHMSGDVVLVRAKETVEEILRSMSHGTGEQCHAVIASLMPTPMTSQVCVSQFLFRRESKTPRCARMVLSSIATWTNALPSSTTTWMLCRGLG